MADTITYKVADIRFVPATGKVAEKNPDRFGTVHGTEFRTVDEKGKTGDALSIVQKVIDKADAANPLTVIDLDKGLLTLPEGRRGREKSAGSSSDELAEMLKALRDAS